MYRRSVYRVSKALKRAAICTVYDDDRDRTDPILPEHIIEKILLLLPLQSIIRCRSVCKHWRALLSSALFSARWIQICNGYPQLLLHNLVDNVLYWFCFFAGKWNTISLPPSSLPIHSYKGPTGGLTLIENSNSTGILVCNPFMQKTFELPPVPGIRHMVAKFIIKGDEKEPYKVVAVGDNRRWTETSMGIYDGSEKSWKVLGHFWPEIFLSKSNELVYRNGWFFCKTSKPNRGVRIYSIRDIRSIAFVPLPGNINFESVILVACTSSVLMVEDFREKSITKDIIVWQLVQEDSKPSFWKEIARMPSWLLEDFNKTCNVDLVRAWGWFNCVGAGDYIFLRRGSGNRNVLAYNLQQGDWIWLPQCPSGDGENWFHMSAFTPGYHTEDIRSFLH